MVASREISISCLSQCSGRFRANHLGFGAVPTLQNGESVKKQQEREYLWGKFSEGFSLLLLGKAFPLRRQLSC